MPRDASGASRKVRLACLAVAGLLLVACDNIVSYDIVNETDAPVRTGWFYEPCSVERERRLRRGTLQRVLAPGATESVSGVVPRRPKCVVVKDFEESVIVLSLYRDGATYVVRGSNGGDSFEVAVRPASPRDEASEGEHAAKRWGGFVVLGVLCALFASGAIAAAVLTTRFFISYYRPRL